MKQISCTRRIQFCAGHRVYGHESKCANMHGHNYVAFFEAEAWAESLDDALRNLDHIGRVIDFSVLKEKIGGWIDENWDHGFLFFSEDTAMRDLFVVNHELIGPGAQKHFMMPVNPTAENMAWYLLRVQCPALLEGTGVRVRKVTIWETENCFAEATL